VRKSEDKILRCDSAEFFVGMANRYFASVTDLPSFHADEMGDGINIDAMPVEI